jgi:Fe-S-cluster containining protein
VASPHAFKDHPARAELTALYAEVDALLAPFSCVASAECCNFANTGRQPCPTAVELAEVREAMRRAGVTLGRAPKRLPVAGDRTCPLLGRDGRCRIYASRPFGCRTYFCERRTGPNKMPRAEIQEISRRIADLSARFDPRDPGPRPLSRALDLR